MIATEIMAAAVPPLVLDVYKNLAELADYRQSLDRRCATEDERVVRIDQLYGFQIAGRPFPPITVGDRIMGLTIIPKPCRYCGRTKQTPKHRTCDGCGATKDPMEGRRP